MQASISLSFLVAFIICIFATPLSLIFIKKWGIFDDPAKHKHPAILHKKPIPRAGGIPIFISLFIPTFIFLGFSKITLALFAASLITVVTGVLDDKYDISPYTRFGINIITAVIIVASGVGIPFITNPFGGIIYLDALRLTFHFAGLHSILVFSDLFAIFWIVWVMNMLNWSKGVDGQMPGVVAISAIVIGLLSLRFPLSDPFTLASAKISFIIAGSALGFLVYNFYPAKIFPGYSATVLYLLLATVSILSGAKLATAVLVMGVPMVDGIFTIVRRILTGHSPFWHDKKHLHHLLLGMGVPQRKIALSYWLFSAILGVISLLLPSRGKLYALVMLGVVIGGILVFLHLFRREHTKTTL